MYNEGSNNSKEIPSPVLNTDVERIFSQVVLVKTIQNNLITMLFSQKRNAFQVLMYNSNPPLLRINI